MDAKEIVLIAFGPKKIHAIKDWWKDQSQFCKYPTKTSKSDTIIVTAAALVTK